MKKFCDVIYLACKWVIIVFGYFLVGVITIGIISRYVIHRPIIWEYEACIALFIWCTFLGAATCFRDKQHVAFGMLVGVMPQSLRNLVLAFKNIMIILVLIAGMYYGRIVVDSTWFIEYQTIPFSLSFSYAALPVGFLISLLFVIENIVANGISAE